MEARKMMNCKENFHIEVVKILKGTLHGVQEAASSNLATPTRKNLAIVRNSGVFLFV